MVKALWGKCNGANIILSLNEQGRWTATVPAAEGKAYILELWAEDEAGNIGYFATLEAVYDSGSLCVKVKVTDLGSNVSLTDVKSVLAGDRLSFKWRVP